MTKPTLSLKKPVPEATIEVAGEEEVLTFGNAGAEPLAADPSMDQSELLTLVLALQSKITQLEADGRETARKVDAEYDMTDDLFFISKPNGEKWTERRVIDKKAVECEMIATAFFGPFKNREDIEIYLAKKRGQREGNEYDWDTVRVLTGREARAIRRRETEEREAQYQGVAHINVLDRKIFAAANGNHQPSLGTLVGPG